PPQSPPPTPPPTAAPSYPHSFLHTPHTPLFFLNPPATTQIYTLSLHDALPISGDHALGDRWARDRPRALGRVASATRARGRSRRSEEHTSELQSRGQLVCRLLLEKKKKNNDQRLIARVVRVMVGEQAG